MIDTRQTVYTQQSTTTTSGVAKGEVDHDGGSRISKGKRWIMQLGVTSRWFWSVFPGVRYRARQLYKNISMLFLFPVKDGKLSTGVNATFDASCYS